MKVGAVATPLLLVVTVEEPLKVPLAPLEGAVKVTDAPLTGLLFVSRTLACSAVAKAAPTAALCGVPAVAVMLAVVTLLPFESAAALRLTLPVPDAITQLTRRA